MTPPSDDELDALLRAEFDGPVPDDGFCSAVMEHLPARRQRRSWPMIAGTVTGVAACGVTLAAAPIANAGWRDWLSGDLTGSAVALVAAITGMAMLALAWALAEADDRPIWASQSD